MIEFDLPFDAYLAKEGISQSDLREISRSPLHWKYSREHPTPPTPAMILGSATHCYILEPEMFEERYVIKRKLDGRTKEGKAQAEALDADPRDAITEEQFENVKGMAQGIARLDIWPTLGGFTPEVSLFWQDPGVRVPCKGRLDGYHKDAELIFDIKTCRCASEFDFARTVADRRYYGQAAWYMHGAAQCGLSARHYVILAVESEPPYAAACYRLLDDILALGQAENDDLLKRAAICQANSLYPGYPTFTQDMGIPVWLQRKLEGTYGAV